MKPDAIAKVQDFVSKHGINEAAKRLGVSRTAICSAIGGRAQRGTLALVEQNIASLDEVG